MRRATLFDKDGNIIPDCGLSESVLEETDVLIWWTHEAHSLVPDDVVECVQRHINCGMGAVFLHSAHFSKLFKRLMGTPYGLLWCGIEKERLWNIAPGHPIMQGIDRYFDIPEEEMYSEQFQIPEPDEL